MVAAYSVKINGKWYRTGEELPSPDNLGEKAEQTSSPDNADEKPTKSKITFMKGADLKALAEKEGFDPGKYTMTQLKEKLIKHFGL